MPKKQNISSDSDSEAPETLQLNTAKDNVLERERVVKDFHTSTAKRRKELNKAREDVRKAASDERRRKLALIQPHTPGKTKKSSVGSAGGRPAGSDLGSSENDPGSSGSDGDSDDTEERAQDDAPAPAQDHLPQLSKSDVASSSSSSLPPPSSTAAGSYLPDEVFARAKADTDAHQAKLDIIEKRRLRRAAERAKKDGKKGGKTKSSSSSKLSSKETVVGSTQVKALAAVVRRGPAPPSNSLKQFIKHSRLKKKGRFERRPMNLILSTGPRPALNFRRQ